MKTNVITPSAPAASANFSSDSPKLLSLLALATGAVALPQTGNADIIYTDRNSNPVTVGYAGAANFIFGLPGTAVVGLVRTTYVTTSSSFFPLQYRSVIAGDLGGPLNAPAAIQVVNGVAAHLPFGAAWDQGNALTNYTFVGWANTFNANPNAGYDREYLAWQFVDDSPGGGTRYGWAEISLSITLNGGGGSGPNVTLYGYAYDNTGAKPTMGVVPEPSSGALLAMGAMALGARGLRDWRRNRDTLCKS